jgi:hypothetical protein
MKDSIIVHGQDFLTAVPLALADRAIVGKNLLNIFISPAEFPQTRLQAFAALFEKFCFRKLWFHFDTSSPTSRDGAIVLSYDRDVSDPTPPTGVDGLREYLAHSDARTCATWEDCTVRCTLDDTFSSYYTNQASSGGDERLAYQGQFYIALSAGNSTLTADSTLGNVWFEYELELFEPQMDDLSIGCRISTDTAITNPSVVAKAAWNQLASKVVLGVPGKVSKITDSSGNTGFYLPTGWWKVVQSFLADDPATQTHALSNWLIPTVIARDSSKQSLTAINNIYSTPIENTTASPFNGMTQRADKIYSPIGGMDVFGSFSLGSNSYTNDPNQYTFLDIASMSKDEL